MTASRHEESLATKKQFPSIEQYKKQNKKVFQISLGKSGTGIVAAIATCFDRLPDRSAGNKGKMLISVGRQLKLSIPV